MRTIVSRKSRIPRRIVGSVATFSNSFSITRISAGDKARKAKAFLLSLWDGQEKTALRIDLWTKDMMVDEMEDFFYQTLVTLADTYQRATQYGDLAEDIKVFARDLYNKSRARQIKENKL